MWGWPAHWPRRKCVHADSIGQLTTTCQIELINDPERVRGRIYHQLSVNTLATPRCGEKLLTWLWTAYRTASSSMTQRGRSIEPAAAFCRVFSGDVDPAMATVKSSC